MKRLLTAALAAALLVTGIAVLPGCNGASNSAIDRIGKSGDKGFSIKTLANRNRKFGLFVPLSYNASQKYPTIIFLHGVGEGGGDAKKNMTVGLGPFVAARAADFPFICIFPQSSSGSWNENSSDASDVIAILDQVSKEYAVDQDRVSLTGLSTGGYGTYAIGAKYKDRFAALVPMASNAGASQHAAALVNMPIRAFCNGGDMFGGFAGNDRGMIEKIKTLGGKQQEFTMTNDAGHNCWEGVYSSGELFSWLLQQRRRTTAVTPSAAPRVTSSLISAPAPAPVTPIRSNAAASVNTPY